MVGPQSLGGEWRREKLQGEGVWSHRPGVICLLSSYVAMAAGKLPPSLICSPIGTMG